MADLAVSPQADVQSTEVQTKARSSSTFARVARYTLLKTVSLLITVIIGVYLTILIANMGGYVDKIREGAIQENIGLILKGNPQVRTMTDEQRKAYIADLTKIQEKRYGMDQPFLIRSFRYLGNAIVLDLGFSENMVSDSGSRSVQLILLERLPSTMVLQATAQLLLFFLSIFIALALSRQYGSFMDKLVVALTPTSAAPGWFFALFLIVFFAAWLHILPFGGMVSAPPPSNPLQYALSLGQHMIIPVAAILLNSIVISIYTWRTFFLIYSSEDYVELAKAKGLPDRTIESRYILRPTLPNIITNFAFTLIALWTGAIVLETVTNWPGLGRTLFQAIGLYDTPVIVASTVIYAYLLALTVFVLDFVYALVDPRVKVGGEG
jgi:peptide/nickel transport system permease protein